MENDSIAFLLLTEFSKEDYKLWQYLKDLYGLDCCNSIFTTYEDDVGDLPKWDAHDIKL